VKKFPVKHKKIILINMKKIGLISIFFLLAVVASRCGNGTQSNSGKSLAGASDTGIAIITFKELEHDFGKVAEGEKVGFVFNFENTGTGNLVIQAASTTCGCTVPRYDTKPISPGRDGEMEVIFDTSGRSGVQTKIVTVKSNASVPVVMLKITADVITNNNN
jgi:hypothetical protein